MTSQGRGIAPEDLQHLRAYASQERALGDAVSDQGNPE